MSARTLLIPSTVRDIYRDCLYVGNDRSKGVGVPNILTPSFRYFDKDKIKEHHDEINSMLSQLPNDFKSATGANFNRTRLDRHEDTWSPAELSQEQLVQLGIAIGMIMIVEPRAKWSSLPNGRPTLKLKP